MKKELFSLALLAIAQMGVAKDIKGTVTDAATGEPLAGVHVQAYGNPRYVTMTAKDGTYSLSIPDNVSSLYLYTEGMQSQQLSVGSNLNQVDAKLFSEAFKSNYSDKTVANRVAVSSDFDNNVEASIDPFIQQRMNADVRTISRGGSDGVGNVMFIGGLNSLNANAQPLIVIDGVLMDMQYDRDMLHDGYYNNLLANINVNDIEKVEVLKNGTALYGAKGANGVILITTKRNKSMATKIDVTLGGKFMTMPRTAKMMGAEDYRTYASEMLSTEVENVSSMTFLNTDKKYFYYPMYHNNTDWKKQVYQDSWAQKYGINVQGGDDVANYNLSVGYTSANSTLKENEFSRFDMRLNTDIDVIEKLHVRFDASFSDVKRNLRDIGLTSNIEEATITSPNSLSLIKAPFLAPYAHDVNGQLSSYLAAADNYLPSSLTTNDKSLANPVSILDNGNGENRNTFGNRLVMFNVTPSFEFSKHLKLTEAFNFTLVNTNENYYLPIEGVPTFRIPGINDLTQQITRQNVVRSLAARQNSIQSDTRLNWNNTFGLHSISAMGGFRIVSSTYTLNVQNGYNTGNDKTPNMSYGLSNKSTSGADSRFTDLTMYALADYNYAQKFYVSAGVSAQASSRFGREASGMKLFNTVWGLFPSAQFSYVLTNEKFLAGSNVLNYLRINAGIDVTGNDNIDYTAARTYFIAKSMLGKDNNVNTLDGKILSNVGNSTLKWETTRRITLGAEANLFKNHLTAKFNFFKSYTSDLLTLSSMAWVSGLPQVWSNNGKLENTGYDLSLNYKFVNTRDWHWEAGFSVGKYTNEVTALNEGKRILTEAYGATILTQEGNPLGVFYGYKTNGVYSTTAEAQADGLYQLDKAGNKVYFQAGDMRFVDMNGDKVINEDDRTIIGDPNPDSYGNIFSRLNWKKWQLDINLTYCIGNDIYNYERSILEGGKYFYNQTNIMTTRWTTEGQITTMPRASYQDTHGNARFSDRWIEDGSYLRLSNVTLSYTLPINRAFLQGLTVYGTAQNLFTLTKYLGSNPDCTVSGSSILQGIDRGLLGLGRSFSVGVKINL